MAEAPVNRVSTALSAGATERILRLRDPRQAGFEGGTCHTVGASLLYLAVAVGGWLLALVAFRRRDLAA